MKLISKNKNIFKYKKTNKIQIKNNNKTKILFKIKKTKINPQIYKQK